MDKSTKSINTQIYYRNKNMVDNPNLIEIKDKTADIMRLGIDKDLYYEVMNWAKTQIELGKMRAGLRFYLKTGYKFNYFIREYINYLKANCDYEFKQEKEFYLEYVGNLEKGKYNADRNEYKKA